MLRDKSSAQVLLLAEFPLLALGGAEPQTVGSVRVLGWVFEPGSWLRVASYKLDPAFAAAVHLDKRGLLESTRCGDAELRSELSREALAFAQRLRRLGAAVAVGACVEVPVASS